MKRLPYYLILAYLSGCCGSSDIVSSDGPFTYTTPTEADLLGVEAMVAGRDLTPRDVELVHQEMLVDTRELRIYKHRVGAHDHFGVVVLPTAAPNAKFPIAIVAGGLRQSDLTFHAGPLLETVELLDPAFKEMVLLLPSFRGRALVYEDMRFQSTGDTCDAFDGSSDDTMALLNVVMEEVTQADADRIVVLGLSRGGTIAHLVGQRDDRIDMIIASGGLVDFNRADTQWYPFYECHFLGNRTPAESRMRILASSPLHFAKHSTRSRLHHGILDDKVPIWNADEMYSRLLREGKDVTLTRYDFGHALSPLPAFQQNVRKDIAEFLAQ